VKYAVSKIELSRFKDVEDIIVLWVPYVKITYITDDKKKEMCFDGFFPPKIGDTEIYVWLMRNPKHFKVEEGDITYGHKLPLLVDGKTIFREIQELRAKALKIIWEAGDTVTKIPKRSMLQLFIPAQFPESKKLKLSERYFPIFALIDAAGITAYSGYVSEETIYWPIIVDTTEDIVYEPALKKDKSFSYTELHKRFNIVEITKSYIDEC